jgi:hypothetical protein
MLTWLGYTNGAGGRYVNVRWTHEEVGDRRPSDVQVDEQCYDLQFDGKTYELFRDEEGDVSEEHTSLPPGSTQHDTVCLDIFGLHVIGGVDLDLVSRRAATEQAARPDALKLKAKKCVRDLCLPAQRPDAGK